MAHIAVIGAGITGVTTTYALLEKGYEVTVFDRHRYAAMETSYANGGQLSASNAEVWNNWSTVLKGISWLFRSDAPLSLNLKPSWHKYSWLAEFVANIPNYRLVECHAEYQHLFRDVARLKLSEVGHALTCILWDARAGRIISVAEYRQRI